MSEVPQRPAPVNRGDRFEVVFRRRRGGSPFQRPRIPWIITCGLARSVADDHIGEQHHYRDANDKSPDRGYQIHGAPSRTVWIGVNAPWHSVQTENVLDKEGHVKSNEH